ATVFHILNEMTRAVVENPVDKVLREGTVVGLANHTVLVKRDGSETPIDDSAAPIIAGDGLQGVVLVFRDASEEKKSIARRVFLAEAGTDLVSSADYEDALRRIAWLAVPRLADWCAVDVVENGEKKRLAVAHVDPEKIAYALDLETRYPPDRNAPTDVPNVLRTGKSELYPEIPQQMLEAAAVDAEHLRLLRALDLRSAMVVPLRGRDAVYGAISFVFAESKRRYTDDDLALAEELARIGGLVIERRKLEAEATHANRMKDEFLALVSHELRTPLQAIIGWSAILKRGTKDVEQAVGAIERNALVQARLIDDILDIARVISGKLDLAIRRCDVRSVVQAAMDSVRPAAAKKSIDLSEHTAGDVGAIDADAGRLQQVITNLVHNAVKFTPAGGAVTVQTDIVGDKLRIAVRDTGQGIAKENLE